MYDALVVGGRCAGAATALLLARAGRKVLIVDQAPLPSDVKLSTHLIWHAGVDQLHRWGLLEAVQATGAPLLTRFSLDLGELVLSGQPPDTVVGAAIAPRRLALDKVLLDAALQAGAELRDGVSFEDVITDDEGRVCGIRGRASDGSAFTAHARVVVGADGSHSRVARAVGAQAGLDFPKEAGSYNIFAYMDGVPLNGVSFYSRPQRMFYSWATNDGRAVIGLIQPGDAPRPSREDNGAYVQSAFSQWAPELAERVRAGRLDGDWVGGAVGAFSRQAAGPGWCLVGDAGVTMDPITAAGISNAFRDAELAADLIHEGLSSPSGVDEALARLQPRRDEVALPLLQFTQEMAKLAPPTPEVMQLFVALAGNQPQIDRYYGVFAQTVSPGDFFGPENMARIFQAPA